MTKRRRGSGGAGVDAVLRDCKDGGPRKKHEQKRRYIRRMRFMKVLGAKRKCATSIETKRDDTSKKPI